MHKTLTSGEMLHLRDRGVEKIRIHYSGGGDSGQIDDIVYLVKSFNKTFSEEELSIASDIHSKLESVSYRLLDGIGDWYNNEGGQGIIEINLPDLEYTIDAQYNLEETGEYDEETNGWVPDDYQQEPIEEYYDGVLEKD